MRKIEEIFPQNTVFQYRYFIKQELQNRAKVLLSCLSAQAPES